MVREPDATMQPAPQDNQLMSKHCVLSLKPHLRLEWRGQDGQDETEQSDHSTSLGDSTTSSTRIRFSVQDSRAAMYGLPAQLPAPYPTNQSMVANLVATVSMRLRNVARPNAPARLLPMTALASHQCAGSRRRLRQAKRTRPAGAAPP
jgi:gamma-glutamyl:cysteine ligase YbdK (ATP-grasp superfamily)